MCRDALLSNDGLRERALWASFTAGSSTPKEDEAKPVAIKMVKIEKRYRFAGEDVVWVQ